MVRNCFMGGSPLPPTEAAVTSIHSKQANQISRVLISL